MRKNGRESSVAIRFSGDSGDGCTTGTKFTESTALMATTYA
jgi:hypothetical protein